MKCTLFYNDAITDEVVGRGYVLAEHMVSFLTKMGHSVNVLGHTVLSTTLMKTMQRRNRQVVKEIDLTLIEHLNNSDVIFYVSTENFKKDQFPNDMREMLKLSIDKFNLRRWNIYGVSCFVVTSKADKSIKVAKNIWDMFSHLELSMCMQSFQQPLMEERRDVKESAVPTI